ncbi:glutathione S-transferase T3-like [Helianthus annuus]|uniref:glutathione S-transferase T3-like n=1 Tax=Helianthus annuus TaxID=4232 RepID=UPI000B8F678C|nr:glutathione S-transferase T3-like [Helianthus annuus]
MQNKEVYRENDSLSSKWSDVTLFNGCFHKAKNSPRSGETEADFIQNAMVSYRENKKAEFKYMHCWNICRYASKWATVPTANESTSSKRARTPSSQAEFDARDQELDLSLDDFDNSLSRPPGRDTSKKRFQRGRSGSTSGSATSSASGKGLYTDQLLEIGTNIDTFIFIQQQRVEVKKNIQVARKKKRHLTKKNLRI